MTVFADASAVVKLYADEPGADSVRRLDTLLVSRLTRVEVLSALHRKHRRGEIDAPTLQTLRGGFTADWFDDPAPRFVGVVDDTDGVLEVAGELISRLPRRAYDAVQLASAVSARRVDPECDRMACFDGQLRRAASVQGFGLVPRSA